MSTQLDLINKNKDIGISTIKLVLDIVESFKRSIGAVVTVGSPYGRINDTLPSVALTMKSKYSSEIYSMLPGPASLAARDEATIEMAKKIILMFEKSFGSSNVKGGIKFGALSHNAVSPFNISLGKNIDVLQDDKIVKINNWYCQVLCYPWVENMEFRFIM